MTILEGTLDMDSNEMVPTHLWSSVFGTAGSRIAAMMEPMLETVAKAGSHELYCPDLVGDITEITSETVWNQKGSRAPGAIDFSRRLDVLDQMQISKQLIFPSFGLVALMAMYPQSFVRNSFRTLGIDLSDEEFTLLGREGLEEHNGWVRQVTALEPDRLRPVGYLPPCSTVSELASEAVALIDSGIRAVHIPHSVPPGGRSPAHPDLDPFWQLMVERDVACVTHLGAEFGFVQSSEWVHAPAFALGKVQSHELGLEPYSVATVHLPICNFLTCMVLGGVFERHPRLRFGAIELGCSWVGPLADLLDLWTEKMFSARLSAHISKRPSEYFAQNVRVTPFNYVEPVEEYFVRYPHLADCYCYSSDYPHNEGGTESARKLYDQLSHLGEGVLRKFFITNAELLFPL